MKVFPGIGGRRAEYLLAGIIIARSTSNLCSKIALKSIGPFSLMSIRFVITFVLLLPLFMSRLKRFQPAIVTKALLLGTVFFAEMSAETFALRQTDISTAALLVNSAIVLVPLMEAGLRRRLPRAMELAGALTTFCGIGFLAFQNGQLTWQGGEALCILSAFGYASYIILTDRLSQDEDPLLLGICQIGFLAIYSSAAALLSKTTQFPDSGEVWIAILWLAVVCTGFGLTLQPVAQRYTSAERTAIFCALNPLTASILGYIFLKEEFGLPSLLGAALILMGILLSST